MMNTLTRPIRVVFDTNAPGYKLKTYTATLGIYALLAGDSIRYLIGWWAWGTLLIAMLGVCIALLIRGGIKQVLWQTEWPLWAFFAWMSASIFWSNYSAITALAIFAQIATTVFALFLTAQFSWRHLLRIFANVVRFILGSSLLFELYAALVVHGPIAPIFKNYSGDKPPAAAYYWTQGHLFDGERIQGIVGNSNLLAFVGMLGLVLFAIEYAIIGTKRWISAVSWLLSVGSIWLAKSAGIGFAILGIAIAAIVSIAAEGKSRDIRHRYYRAAWAVAGTVGIVIVFFRAAVFEFIGKSPDMTGRSGIWKLVLKLIEQRPVFGWGWISHWVPGVKPYEGLVVIKGVPYYQAHNAYLDITLQLGIIGAALFGILLLTSFIKLWRLAVRHTSALYLWPVLIFVGLAVWSLTESRLLIEIGWTLLMLFVIKVNDPIETLEPVGRSPKRARLFRSRKTN